MYNKITNYEEIHKILEHLFNPQSTKLKIILGTEEGLIFFSNLKMGEKLIASFKKIFDIFYSINYKQLYLFKKLIIQTNNLYSIILPLNINVEKYIVWIEFPKGFSSRKCMIKAENIIKKIKGLFNMNSIRKMDLTGIEPVTS